MSLKCNYAINVSSFPLNVQAKYESEMHKKVEDDELHSIIITLSDFCFQHYQLPLPIFCLKIASIGEGYRNDLQMLPQIQMYRKKLQHTVQRSIFMLLYDLLISFPVRHTDIPGLMGAISLAT